jgi:hypothetical protein
MVVGYKSVKKEAKKQELLSRMETERLPTLACVVCAVTSPDQPVRSRTILMSPRLDALPMPEAADVAQATTPLGELRIRSQHDTSLDA